MSQDAKKSHGSDAVPIFIDDVKYEAPSQAAGAIIRALVPVPENQDLWLDTHGKDDDILIQPVQSYEIKPGSHFYTAPSTINPGSI